MSHIITNKSQRNPSIERVMRGEGVVGVRCACCHNVVMVVNAFAFRSDLLFYGSAYYVCKACSEKDDLEECLVANRDGLELLVSSGLI